MCSGLGDIGSEQYRYRDRNVPGEEVAKNSKGNNTEGKRKQYGKTKSGRRRRAHTEGPGRLNEEQSESKQNMEQKALRFPSGEGVMPPAVWGL